MRIELRTCILTLRRQVLICLQVFVESCQIFLCHFAESPDVHVVLQVMYLHLLGDGIETSTADELLIGLVISACNT